MDTAKRNKYFFREGEEVCHIENTAQKMFIQKVVFRFYDRPTPEDPLRKEAVKKITGIVCHWWDKNGNFYTNEFFKGLLVPYDVASEGSYAEIQKWIAEHNS